MGAKKENETINAFIHYMEVLCSEDFTDSTTILGKIQDWCRCRINNGTVDVSVNGKKVAELKDGQFVGEMSFLTGKSATADCIVKHDSECLVWKQKEFKELLKRNPSLYYSIQSLLSNQLISYSNKN